MTDWVNDAASVLWDTLSTESTDNPEKSIAEALRKAKDDERKAIVAWLKAESAKREKLSDFEADYYEGQAVAFFEVALAFERGEHIRTPAAIATAKVMADVVKTYAAVTGDPPPKVFICDVTAYETKPASGSDA